MFSRRSIQFAVPAAVALCVGACGNDEISSPTAGGETITDFVASVSYDGTPGDLQDTGIPRPRSEGPELAIDGHVTVVNGGSATMTVTSPTPFQTVYVAGSAPISGLFVPVSGFFATPLPAAATSADVLITFPQNLPGGEFALYFSATDADGNVGGVTEVTYNALAVGSGDVQVTVTWDTDADVDLHVVDPSGEEIFYGNRASASGGELDLDSNAACITDGVRNENITWGAGAAPQGTYHVRVDYWDSCDYSETNYTVLVYNGGDAQIFRGSFQGGGDHGGSGSGVPITSFTRTSGALAPPMAGRSTPFVPAGVNSK